MQKYKIECYRYNEEIEEYEIVTDNIEIGNESYSGLFKVVCDEKEDNNSFIISSYGDDEFVIKRNRCEIQIIIKPNLTQYEKEFHVVMTHAQDSNVSTILDIIQSGQEYAIGLDGMSYQYMNKNERNVIIENEEYNNLEDSEKEKYIRLYTLFLKKEIYNAFGGKSDDINYNYYEEKTVNVTVNGGNQQFRIYSILKYNYDEEENSAIPVNFDNGFVYTQFSDYILIRNYGMPFLNIEDYYEIGLCHDNAKDINLILRLKYQEVSSQRPHIIATPQNQHKRIIQEQSDIYLTNSKLKELYNNDNMVKIVNERQVYDIRFDEEIENNYIVYNKPQDVSFSFKVYENENESNLMVGVYSSGKWCVVETDETNRNLIIRIKNQPLFERKTFVKVFIIDHPTVYKSFYLINKPSRN